LRETTKTVREPATAENLEDRVFGDTDIGDIAESLHDLAAFYPVVFRTGRTPHINEGVLAYFERAGNSLLGAVERFRFAEDLLRSRGV